MATQTAYPANGARIAAGRHPGPRAQPAPRCAQGAGGQQRQPDAEGARDLTDGVGPEPPGTRDVDRAEAPGCRREGGRQQRRGAEERAGRDRQGLQPERHAAGCQRQQRHDHDRDVLAQRFRGRVLHQGHRDLLVAGQALARTADPVADPVADGQVGGALAGQ
jgi:hypothetical protein